MHGRKKEKIYIKKAGNQLNSGEAYVVSPLIYKTTIDL